MMQWKCITYCWERNMKVNWWPFFWSSTQAGLALLPRAETPFQKSWICHWALLYWYQKLLVVYIIANGGSYSVIIIAITHKWCYWSFLLVEYNVHALGTEFFSILCSFRHQVIILPCAEDPFLQNLHLFRQLSIQLMSSVSRLLSNGTYYRTSVVLTNYGP